MKKILSLVMFVSLIVLAGCGGQQKSETPAPAAAPAETAPAQQAAQPAQPAAVKETAAPSAPSAATTETAALTAETLVGTKWQAGPYTLEFQANGVLVLNNDTQGTWSVEGNAVKVSAGDKSYTAEIKGDKLFYGGMPLSRLN